MLTSSFMQWMQMKAMTTMPSEPKTMPEFLMAMGRVRTPMPMLPLIRWMIVAVLL